MQKKEINLFLLVFLALLPLILLRDFTLDNELRYFSIADEAIREGRIFVFYNNNEMYADKPPLYLWIIMLGRYLFGSNLNAFTHLYVLLWSIIPSFVILHTMNNMLKRQSYPQSTLTLGMVITSTTAIFVGLSIFARMDMLMMMFITLALYEFVKGWQDWNSKRVFMFGFYIFMGLFSKGPMALVIPFLSTSIFLISRKRSKEILRWWGWITFLIIFIGLTLWFGGIYLEAGREYIDNMLINQVLGRALDATHHKQPFYFYAICFWYVFAPWSPLMIYLAAKQWHSKHNDIEHLFMIVVVSTFIILSVFSSKLQVYLSPASPFAAYLLAIMISKEKWADRFSKHCMIGHKIFFGLIFIASLFLMPIINRNFGMNNVCDIAKETRRKHKLSGYSSFGIKRAENLDVILGEKIEKIELNDVLKGKSEGRVLIIRKKNLDKHEKLRKYIINKQVKVADNRYFIVFS